MRLADRNYDWPASFGMRAASGTIARHGPPAYRLSRVPTEQRNRIVTAPGAAFVGKAQGSTEAKRGTRDGLGMPSALQVLLLPRRAVLEENLAAKLPARLERPARRSGDLSLPITSLRLVCSSPPSLPLGRPTASRGILALQPVGRIVAGLTGRFMTSRAGAAWALRPSANAFGRTAVHTMNNREPVTVGRKPLQEIEPHEPTHP
jgi:hypothetical protein